MIGGLEIHERTVATGDAFVADPKSQIDRTLAFGYKILDPISDMLETFLVVCQKIAIERRRIIVLLDRCCHIKLD